MWRVSRYGRPCSCAPGPTQPGLGPFRGAAERLRLCSPLQQHVAKQPQGFQEHTRGGAGPPAGRRALCSSVRQGGNSSLTHFRSLASLS